MKKTTLNDLYIEELQDLLSAENQLLKALPKIISAVETKELKDALSAHLQETEGHVERLNQVFELLEEKPEQKLCKAMEGLLKEGAEILEEIEKGVVRDAALIGACQRVEHYEMAAYGTTRAFATALGFEDQAEILTMTLDEEGAADDTLTGIAEDTVNPGAMETKEAVAK